MKTLLSIGLMAIFCFQSLKAQDNMSAIMDYMAESSDGLKASLDGLNDGQLAFKPADSVWSAMGVMEHIILTEGWLFNSLKETVKGPEATDLPAPDMEDEQLINGVTDRSNKIKTFPALEPQGSFKTMDEAWKAFKDQRKKIKKYLKNSDANLENYRFELPFGKVDGNQYLKFMAAHTIRHTKQIQELKAMAEFPR